MPFTARGEDHRLLAGTQAAATIAAANPIRLFPIQSDQYDRYGSVVAAPWAAPMGIAAPEYARTSPYADFSQAPDGKKDVNLTFSMWTFGMTNYVFATILSGAYSGPVSIMTYDIYNQPVYLNAMLWRTVVGNLSAIIGGYETIKLVLKGGTTAT